MRIYDKMTELISSAMKSGDTLRLNTIKMIKTEMVKQIKSNGKELTEKDEEAVLIAMVAQYEKAINEYRGFGKNEEADKVQAELEIIKEFAPKIASEDEIRTLTMEIANQYIKSKGEGFSISMKDMKPIMDGVKETYPTANGKVISEVIKSLIP